jgi:signal peptidase I
MIPVAYPARPALAIRLSGRWLDRAANAICAITIAAVVAAGLLTLLGYRVLLDRTDSMQPAIRAGDLVINHEVPARSLRAGDIVTFPDQARPGRLITHRIVKIVPLGTDVMVETRGDMNPLSERWTVPASEPIRKLQAHVPWVGRLVPWLPSVPMRLALLLGAALLAAAAVIRRIWS